MNLWENGSNAEWKNFFKAARSEVDFNITLVIFQRSHSGCKFAMVSIKGSTNDGSMMKTSTKTSNSKAQTDNFCGAYLSSIWGDKSNSAITSK